ncbi:NAD-glutamate dehydrogenase [Nocardioides acrostichi]|uniref:NAD-glutamate dehydrogenase n=1 Tax=Nocardioides acrostichi TaxID=2784339 RepID=A0A930V0D3_9ACTN|nr:NAD-glutamate dehydrogenase [Nocardioides acrostichi]MBF4162355.1 NAD-glutamate dehydrogenase [Nocardioides acrostichi]
MSTTTQHAPTSDLSDLLHRAAHLARSGRGSGGPPHDAVEGLLAGYYAHVTDEDLAGRTDADVLGTFASHYRLAGERPQGTARVRVFTPTLAEHGWTAGGHSVVEVVTDDMPFLVDSLTMELSAHLHDVHLVVHPRFDVRRDITGALESVQTVDESVAEPDSSLVRESWMHVEIDRLARDVDPDAVVADLRRVLDDVRDAVEDWPRTKQRMTDIATELRSQAPAGVPAEEVEQSAALLDWLADEHFTFLGYREYRLEEHAVEGEPADVREDVLKAVPGSGLGILRYDSDTSDSFARLPDPVKARAREKHLLVLAKANSRATVHRPAYLDYVGVKTFDESGEVTGERRFLGLFSSMAYAESLTRIPMLREKAAEVLRRQGFDPRSYAGRALMDTLESYPRDELFHTSVEELAPMAESAMLAGERRAVRAITRPDTYGRYVSVLVYLPRDRYNTAVRERFSEILLDRLGGESVEFTVRINESTTARVHFVVHLPRGEQDPTVTGALRVLDTADLERRLADASRSWRDDFLAAVLAEYGEQSGSRLGRRWVDAFPAAYQEDYPARTGAVDLGRLEAIEGDEGLDLALVETMDAGRGEARLKVYRVGAPLSLSAVLPMIASLGVEVVDERPYELEGLDRDCHVYEFGLRYGRALPERARDLCVDALRAVWEGRTEVDGFNQLVLGAGLTWRQATLLRAYAKYMRQGGSPFALDTIEEALLSNGEITADLVRLFEARFDPRQESRDDAVEAVLVDLLQRLEQVASLDHDRILRSYLTHIRATLRTNYFQTVDETEHDYISLKLQPSEIPDLPRPRPKFEIFVYSPRVEGVHLRFGSVARGGLRWSDRRDDFRTEVLGLVKAQMVKNAVIVPVGAKGGFYAKQLPDPSGDRDAWMAEGIAAYETFISGLLDITDNLVDGEVVPPGDVVRHDSDDSYLVVAADKGTATFSDIANELAVARGFWLGDAFASGGSVGYDHKAMGITARGAWVSVQRHFRERGVDCQAEDFTCVGIGDMSGDVFGNGMLCSEHTRLVAAFDHRDIFIDPDPDAASSYAERNRVFELGRSSWADYDTSLISEGGGVWSRSSKSIPVSAAARRALGLADDVEQLPPSELMRAILMAPVDLLWNGGIGTYVKGADETHADAGDKANDAIRIDGEQLRVSAVGEGGNLGLTQAGRIEYALGGGRVCTDFIDNSAGVDTSDHEVNIKILLDRVVAAGDLTVKQRNAVLAEMTDEVAALVLRDNYEQNLALANALNHAPSMLHVHEAMMSRLEGDGVLDRAVEGLPSSAEVERRRERGEGLTAPELSVLLAWTKIVLADLLLGTDLPDDPYLVEDLMAYFPTLMRERFTEQIQAHPLRREIIVTQVVNDIVNGAGITFWARLAGETGASAEELVNANFLAREIFGSLELRERLKALDNTIPAGLQTRMRLEMRTLVERASRWLTAHEGPVIDSEGAVARYRDPVQALMAVLPEVMSGAELADFESRRDQLVEHGVDDDLARDVAVLSPSYATLGVVDTALRAGLDAAEVARVHFALGERLGVPALLERISALPRADRWQTMARAALRDDLHGVHVQLTGQVLATTEDDESATVRISAWEDTDPVVVGRAASTLAEICDDDQADLARLSVGLRVVRSLLRT